MENERSNVSNGAWNWKRTKAKTKIKLDPTTIYTHTEQQQQQKKNNIWIKAGRRIRENYRWSYLNWRGGATSHKRCACANVSNGADRMCRLYAVTEDWLIERLHAADVVYKITHFNLIIWCIQSKFDLSWRAFKNINSIIWTKRANHNATWKMANGHKFLWISYKWFYRFVVVFVR